MNYRKAAQLSLCSMVMQRRFGVVAATMTGLRSIFDGEFRSCVIISNLLF